MHGVFHLSLAELSGPNLDLVNLAIEIEDVAVRWGLSTNLEVSGSVVVTAAEACRIDFSTIEIDSNLIVGAIYANRYVTPVIAEVAHENVHRSCISGEMEVLIVEVPDAESICRAGALVEDCLIPVWARLLRPYPRLSCERPSRRNNLM
jgi:hypothetical protein